MRLRGVGTWPAATQLPRGRAGGESCSLAGAQLLLASPAPGGALGLGVSWAASSPSSGAAVAAAQEGTSRFLPEPPPSPQPSNSGEKRRCTAPLEFISILILEPRFQWIIKLLYNYKQNVCAFSPVLSEWAQAGVERGEVQPAPQEWPAWRFPPVPVPGASESVRAACWGPA